MKFECERSLSCNLQTYNILWRFWAMPAVLGCRYSPDGRSIVLYRPLRISSNSGWLVDEFTIFEEKFDNLNCSLAKDRSFGI
jgi:hypothetical protein